MDEDRGEKKEMKNAACDNNQKGTARDYLSTWLHYVMKVQSTWKSLCLDLDPAEWQCVISNCP